MKKRNMIEPAVVSNKNPQTSVECKQRDRKWITDHSQCKSVFKTQPSAEYLLGKISH